MRLQRHSRRIRRGILFVLVAGLLFGAFFGLQVRDRVRQAGFTGMFGGAPATPAVVAGEKPTEEERSFGAALAAHLRVESVADCRTLAPRLWAGCRAYLRERQGRQDIFGPPDRAQDANRLEALFDDRPPAAERAAAFD